MFTTIQDALDFVYSTTWMGEKLDLSRITELLERLDNPHKKLKYVHVAGTNGKGSTAALLSSVLVQAGYKTGLYTSPFISTFGERIQINHHPISDKDLIENINTLHTHIQKMEEPTTVFETITALAFLYFAKQACDIVVLEVGMGGRLDATNVIDAPEVAIITAIGLDHMEQLGNTTELIAAEKAGIIKKGTHVVVHPCKPSVRAVIEKKCIQEDVNALFVDEETILPLTQSLNGQFFSVDEDRFTISLLGEHQLRNAAVAIAAVNVLISRNWNIHHEALANGLLKAKWPCRFEVMKLNPVFIIDVAHNPQGVREAMRTFASLLPSQKAIIIFGVMADKNYTDMIDLMSPHAAKFITVMPENQRALPADELASAIKNRCAVPVSACASIPEAVDMAFAEANNDSTIMALGSLYMAGEIRQKVMQC